MFAQFENVLDYFHAAWFWFFFPRCLAEWRNSKQTILLLSPLEMSSLNLT